MLISDFFCNFAHDFDADNCFLSDKAMDKKTLEVITYCINKLAQVLHLSQRELYLRLKVSGMFNDYIIPSYDVVGLTAKFCITFVRSLVLHIERKIN